MAYVAEAKFWRRRHDANEAIVVRYHYRAKVVLFVTDFIALCKLIVVYSNYGALSGAIKDSSAN